MRKLGTTQQGVLSALRQHGLWAPWCGWMWDNVGNTTRIMETLVKRGLAKKVRRDGREAYVPVDEDKVKR